MSYEGRVQILCKTGHYFEYDCYEWERYEFFFEDEEEETWTCPICDEPVVWTNHIDDTNGVAAGKIDLDVAYKQEIRCTCCNGTGRVDIPVFKTPPKRVRFFPTSPKNSDEN